jgi:hypothetical protein
VPLTHDFKETVQARARRDRRFRHALLREAVECVINGDLETGKAVLRNYVNATVGFQNLGKTHADSGEEYYAPVGSEGQPVGRQSQQYSDRSSKTKGVRLELALKH